MLQILKPYWENRKQASSNDDIINWVTFGFAPNQTENDGHSSIRLLQTQIRPV